MAAPEIPDFFVALQGGDEGKAEELLRRLDPYLRRVIRLRLIGGRLRHAVDTSDVLQSLVKDFLARTGKVTPRPGAPGGLCAFLAAAVRNKIRKKLRKERRHAGTLPDEWDTVGPEPSPAHQAECRDHCEVVQARLPEDKRRLFDLRMQGLTWREIAAQVGGQPDALRVGLCRAMAEILRDLEDKEPSDGG